MKTKTWLPLFNGFYGTIFEPDETQELEYIEQKRAENGLPELDDLYELCEFDYDSYQEGVSKDCVNFVENILKQLGVVDSIKYESLVSPKYYNFENDSINIEVEITEDNQKRIVSLISGYCREWGQYLKDKYTSYDGFLSSYSNDPEEWNIIECLEHDHKCGAILQFMVFCYACEEGEEYDLLYEKMYEYAASNNPLSAENFIDLTECYKCTCCDDFITNSQYTRSIKHRLNMKYLTLDQIMCSDCALKHENISVLL